MVSVSKMKASLKGGLKPKDTLIPTKKEAASTPNPGAIEPKPKILAYTEITTLPLSKEQKELIQDLGTKLQRQRLGGKKPELNWKSILRGMIGLLDKSTFDGVSVSSEEELHQVIKKKFS